MLPDFTFAGQLAMSQGEQENADIHSVLMENVPGAIRAVMATKEEDRNGIDWWVEIVGGKRVAVDVKVRSRDWSLRGCDDLALESWSVLHKVVGWTRNPAKRTDYVLWLWTDSGRWCLLPFSLLCAVFSEMWQQWEKEFKTARQRTTDRNRGWESQCVFVPRKVVWRAIYERFGGTLCGN